MLSTPRCSLWIRNVVTCSSRHCDGGRSEAEAAHQATAIKLDVVRAMYSSLATLMVGRSRLPVTDVTVTWRDVIAPDRISASNNENRFVESKPNEAAWLAQASRDRPIRLVYVVSLKVSVVACSLQLTSPSLTPNFAQLRWIITIIIIIIFV